MIINIFGNVQSVDIKIAFQILTYANLKITTKIKKDVNNFIIIKLELLSRSFKVIGFNTPQSEMILDLRKS